ncbi:MAG: myxococcus cysteine-rich repeat containing protein [Polyangiaceae bacterium]
MRRPVLYAPSAFLRVLPLLFVSPFALLGCSDGSSEKPPEGQPLDEGPSGGLCAADQGGFSSRPRWSEIGPVPNYEKISTNFNASKSVLLVSSAMNKAVTKIGKVRSELEEIKATGSCDCKGNEDLCDDSGAICAEVLHPKVAREDCQAACDALVSAGVCEATGVAEGWQMDDLYYGARNEARKAIEHVKFLDGIVDFITGSGFGNALSAAGGVATGVQNVGEFIDSVGKVADKFTEGFHVGAYSQDRPDLWYCVPRAGSGVYAPMANLGNGKFSIGASYTSGLAAKKVHGVFSMGAATVEANGKSYPFLPGVAYNLEIDGFKMFDKNTLFGIPGISESGGGINVAAANKADIFNLVDDAGISSLAGADGKVSWHEMLVKGYFPIDYTSHVDQQARVWPRSNVDDVDLERTSKAVFGAGLDMKLEMKKKEFDLPSIPIGGFATVTPFFTVEAGMAWHNQHDKLKSRIEQALSVNPTVWGRDRHAMQAPDSSRDVGVSGHVSPSVGAELNLGLKLAKFIEMGVFARIALKLGIEPGTYGDTIDTSRALAQYLGTINPPVNQPCDPIISTTSSLTCTNPKHACKSPPSPSECETFGRCKMANGQTDEDVKEADCDARRGTWTPYMCAPVTSSNITGWQGPGCNPLSPSGTGYIGLSQQEIEALNTLLAAQAAPNHSIFTYALSDLTFKALLDASAMVQLRLKIFKWKKTFTLFKWQDNWNLGSTNKTWFQEGLEAQYEDDCAAPGGVFNHQPSKVTRYPSITSPKWGQFDTSDELVNNWCYPSIESDSSYANYTVPTNQGVVDSIKNLTDMGHEVGEQMWNSNQLCIGGEHWMSWLASRDKGIADQTCKFKLPNGSTVTGPCDEAYQVIGQSLGCLNKASAPAGAPLTTNGLYVNLAALLQPNAQEIDEASLLATYHTPAWVAWTGQVQQCLDTAHAEQVDVSLTCVDANGKQVACEPKPCCGDGTLSEFEKCDLSAPNSPQNCTAECTLIVCGDGKRQGGEQCDDGNTTSGDGCSATCKKERRDFPTLPGEPSDGPGIQRENAIDGSPLMTPRNQVSLRPQNGPDDLLTGGACEAAPQLFSDVEIASMRLLIQQACGANINSQQCKNAAQAAATSAVTKAQAQGASDCWLPTNPLASTSFNVGGGLLVAQANLGLDLVYRFKEKQFAAFYYKGASIGITPNLGVSGALNFNFAKETTPKQDIIDSWSGTFVSVDLGQMAGEEWVKNFWAASKKWGFGVNGGYFEGGGVKGIYAGITASYSTQGMLDFLGESKLSTNAGVSANHWQPLKVVTEALHEGIFTPWGTLKYRNGDTDMPYIEFTSSTEYTAHMMRNVITIPAALAYVAWGVCNGF